MNAEYQQLVEYLGRQFEAVDRRLEVMDKRQVAALQARIEEIEQRLR